MNFLSAFIEGTNIEDVIKACKSHMQEGPMFFPEDMITDHPECFLVSKIVREKILTYIEKKIPHRVRE